MPTTIGPDNESFEAYACEVASVNIGRLISIILDLDDGGFDVMRVISWLNMVKDSLTDMRHAARTGEYPGAV